jgi:hypothetical protein
MAVSSDDNFTTPDPGAAFDTPTLVGKKTPIAESAAPVALPAEAAPHAVGMPWADVLASEPPEGVRLRALVETLHALSVIHTNLVRPPAERCHGALSPDAVLVTANGGASIFWQNAPDVTKLRPYVAPEVRAGGQPDQQADLYSVGVMLYEALSGRPASELIEAEQADPSDERTDAELDGLLLVAIRAIGVEPARRWRTALTFAEAITRAAGPRLSTREALGEVVASAVSRQERRVREQALDTVRESGPAVAPAQPPPSDAIALSPNERRRRHGLVVGAFAIAALLLLAVSGGYWLTRSSSQLEVQGVQAEPSVHLAASDAALAPSAAAGSVPHPPDRAAEAKAEPPSPVVVTSEVPGSTESNTGSSATAPSAAAKTSRPRGARFKPGSKASSSYEPEGI